MAIFNSVNSGQAMASRGGKYDSSGNVGEHRTMIYDNGRSYPAVTKLSDYLSGISNQVGKAISTAKQVNSTGSTVFSSTMSDIFPSLSDNSYSPSVPSGGGTTAQLPQYLNADLAKAYGMDSTTAYQEALGNTSYQRAVKDLQAAGLNPVLAAGQVAPAGGVYSAHLNGSGVDLSSGVSSAHGSYKFLSSAGGLIGTIIGALNGGVKGAYFGAKVGSTSGGALGNIIDMT